MRSFPKGLVESGRLEPPIFSPATKAQEGDHDENITFDTVVELLGPELAHELRHRALEIYAFGARTAEERGIILADTKFEFGRLPDGEAPSHRRGHDPGFVPVLAPGALSDRPGTTLPGQAAHPGLPGQPFRLGQETTAAGPSPGGGERPAHDRYLEIFRRLTGIDLNTYIPPRFA